MTAVIPEHFGTDIYAPDRYLSGVPHELFTELRRTTPVFWQEMPGEPGYWAILKHEDCEYVSQHPELFSAAQGGIVLENLDEDRLEALRGSLLAMDPPQHRAYRKPLVKSFTAKVVGGMEGRIREICREIFATLPTDGDIEFVHDVTGSLPTQVIGELMGLPREDWDYIHRLAERNTSSQDPEVGGTEEDGYGPGAASMEMAKYAIGFAMKRRVEDPREDLTTLILESEFGGKLMSDVDFGKFFVQLVTAGNDTTKTMLSAGLHALLTHPEQLAALRADPARIPGAVEEILRWANPLHYFRRTATQDVELRGVTIKAGDKVAMYYTSANRDEDVFEDPQRFDITRKPNPHLSFGFAEHFCLGVHIARLEGRVFFEELLAAFPEITLTGEPKRIRSNLNNALAALPVRLTRA
ncbi:cytochrome P450 [Yinghuangia seranimata]|uniref:cytochrome P450 n=1 Tax=Yinghuangia seranimata TaxID=408067 RepID=UPI00248D30B0|nr:cytochrome P450 [Yinghuangia seranimata]MDI2128011.1 cytochrome P450 [Yinghuangia seranimata]